MGLASIGDFDSVEWLARELSRCKDVQAAIERIPSRLTAEVPSEPEVDTRLGFFGIGWAQEPNASAEAQVKPYFCSISNFQSGIDQFTSDPSDEFRAFVHVVDQPPFVHIACDTEENRTSLQETIRGLPDHPLSIAEQLVEYARAAAAENAEVAPPGVISEAFLVTSLPRVTVGDPYAGEPLDLSAGVLGLTPDRRSFMYLRGPSDTAIWNAPWAVCPPGIVLASPSASFSTWEDAEAFFDRLFGPETPSDPNADS